MPRLQLPPHVHMTRSRGREYFAYHPFRGTARAGKRVALPGAPFHLDGSRNREWWAVLEAAGGGPAKPAPKAGTFDALIVAWAGGAIDPEVAATPSAEWRDLAANTRRNYTTALRRIAAAWGPLPVRALEPRHVFDLRTRMEPTPQAFNTLLSALKSMLKWSIPRGWRETNPAGDVPIYRTSEPWAAWPLEAIEAWCDLAVPELRRALMLALYTGQRSVDLVPMTWADVDAGVIRVTQEKTGKRVWIPLHRDLRAELDGVVRSSTRILTGEAGRPFTLESFKTAWQRQHECVELMTGACHGMVPHGLRKSAVCFLLEAGCETAEVAAITGQSFDMIEHYARDINSQRLARRAIAKWEASGNGSGSSGA